MNNSNYSVVSPQLDLSTTAQPAGVITGAKVNFAIQCDTDLEADDIDYLEFQWFEDDQLEGSLKYNELSLGTDAWQSVQVTISKQLLSQSG